MTVDKEVIEIIAEQLGVDKDEVTSDKFFVEDLNADSLDLTELIMTVEGHFMCEISQAEAEKLKQVKHLVAFIEQNRKNK